MNSPLNSHSVLHWLHECSVSAYTPFYYTFQLSLESLTTEKDGLQKNVSDIQETHDVQIKENNRRHEENLKHVQQQVGRCNTATIAATMCFFMRVGLCFLARGVMVTMHNNKN